jgi:hypothetical protein
VPNAGSYRAVDRAGPHHAGIADQGIDAAEAVADLLDEGACWWSSSTSVMIATAREPTCPICSASAVASPGQTPRQ